MKSWHRYTIALIGGLAIGLGAAWWLTGGGLTGGAIVNGPWTTSLSFGTKATDPVTRAAVARAGLLALPAKETRLVVGKARRARGAARGQLPLPPVGQAARRALVERHHL